MHDPIEADEKPIIGADGELSKADSSIDPKVYKEYSARFRELSRQHLNTWDDSRVMLIGFVVVAVVVICILGLVLGWEFIKYIVLFMVLLAILGLKGRSPF